MKLSEICRYIAHKNAFIKYVTIVTIFLMELMECVLTLKISLKDSRWITFILFKKYKNI